MTDARDLTQGWEVALVPHEQATDFASARDLRFLPAQVPGTAAGALHVAGVWTNHAIDLDDFDCWFRVRFTEPLPASNERVFLELGGVATVSAVFLNEVLISRSESMFAARSVDIGELLRTGDNELVVQCAALTPLLRQARRPRARWRTRIVRQGNLRFYRTMLIGRAPGLAAGPPVVGPWRPVTVRRCSDFVVDDVAIRALVTDEGGLVRVSLAGRTLGPRIQAVTVKVTCVDGAVEGPLPIETTADGIVRAHGEVVVPRPALWWPHTHGEPVLHDVETIVHGAEGPRVVSRRRVGFRSVRNRGNVEQDGVQLEVNGIPIFIRGAVWTPVDLFAPHASAQDLDALLLAARDAGMNMLRVSGMGAYESDDFYARCDELGILVWQDFMFANFDYPEGDAGFMDTVDEEVRSVLGRLGWRPSLAVLCGETEVAQQVAMVGLDPQLARGRLFGKVLPTLTQEADVDAIYVPGAPCGSPFPFRVGSGVCNYFGVGAYRRPVDDARAARVRFAAECLAFANIPGDGVLERLGPQPAVVHLPEWKAGVPRDPGAGWDFDDVRDHYLATMFDVDPAQLRRVDPERYLELSRVVTGEVMCEVFGQWRRPGSGCGGALILSFKDAKVGAGWGLLDADGERKSAYHHVRRSMAPIAVWTTDEGLDGIAIHVANDRPKPLHATLRVATYQHLELPGATIDLPVEVAAHGAWTGDLEDLLGCFIDAAWAYRFGPPAQDLIAVSLIQHGELVSQSFRLPAGRPRHRESADVLGLRAGAVRTADGGIAVTVASRRFAYAVRVSAENHQADDDVMSIEPGCARVIHLHPRTSLEHGVDRITLSAVNLRDRVTVPVRAG